MSGSWLLPLALFQRQLQASVSNPVVELGSSVAQFRGPAACFLICPYKGKGVVRINTRGGLCLA